MKKLAWSLMSLALFCLSSQAEMVNTGPTDNQDTVVVTHPSNNNMNPEKIDGQAIKILMVIDDNEIGAAKEVLKKTSHPDVKKFAESMKTAHGKHIKETKKLSKDIKVDPKTSDQSLAIETDGKNISEQLESLEDKDLDKAYIDAMVNGHQAALQAIDDLINEASNPHLVSFLKSTRETVAKHLQSAQDLQKQMNQ